MDNQYVSTIDTKSANPFHHHFHKRQQSRNSIGEEKINSYPMRYQESTIGPTAKQQLQPPYEYEPRSQAQSQVQSQTGSRSQSQSQSSPSQSPKPQPSQQQPHHHHHHHHHHHRHSSSASNGYPQQSNIQAPPDKSSTPGSTLDYSPQASSSEQWKDRGAATIVKSETDASGHTTTTLIKKGVKDFNFGDTLGEGSYSTVVAASDRQTLREYAIKVLDKRHIIKEKKVKYVNIEKNSLNRLGDHPGIIRLYYTFQDERSLYFVLDYAAHGELLTLIKKMGSLDEDCTRYYGAQILDAVDFMHSKGVIHRDLKPENILLDYKMRIKITDFGTAKLLDLVKDEHGNEVYPEEVRTGSFVGTAEYVSPELLTDKFTDKRSDVWAFGCIIFQMIAGRPPFKAANEYQTFQKIVKLQYSYPPAFPFVVRDLVKQLLILNPKNRLDIARIKKHEFFSTIDWDRNSLWKKPPPRIMPYKPSAKSISNPKSANVARLLPSQIKYTPQSKPIKQGIPGGVRASVAAAAALKPQMRRQEQTPPSPGTTPTPGQTTSTPSTMQPPSIPAPAPPVSPSTVSRAPSSPATRPKPSIATLKATESLRALKRAQSQPVVPVVVASNYYKPRQPSTPTEPSKNAMVEQTSALGTASPRLIIPPASQLDSDWSSLLTHHEERILKIGNVPVITSGSGSMNLYDENEDDKEPSIISKFFNGGSTKRKRRIVIITTAARLLICGEDRRLRVEIPIALPQVNIRELQFNKKANTGAFIVEAHHKFITIEDPVGTSEWMTAISKAKEYYQQATALSESNAATAATAAAIAVGQRPTIKGNRVASSGVEGNGNNPRVINTNNSTFLQKSEERRSSRRR